MGDIEKVDMATFQSGLPSTKFMASQIMEELGYNPIKRLVEIDAELRALPDELKDRAQEIGIAKELAKYYSPTMRAVDVNINHNNTMSVNIVRFDYQEPPPLQGEIVDAILEDGEETDDVD